ncbi:MAG: hypothetical protein J6R72_00415 [Candidatus Methanomethylophilaceae archaeon]|nr:hypothetical protein [Candidatus Methanomethylophilaceae archaeon]
MKDRLSVTIFAMFVAVCLLGCGVIYVFSPDHDVTLSRNPDGSVTFEIDGILPESYAYMVLEDVHVYDSIYYYSDGNYPVIDDYSQYEVDLLFDTLDRMMYSRGYASFEKVDATELSNVMSDTSLAHSTAIIVPSGALPDTVQAGNVHSKLDAWLSAGGSMYWMGGNPCRYYSTHSGIMESDHGLFDDSLFNTKRSDKGATECSPIASEFGFAYSAIDDAISIDAPNSKVIGLYNDEFSSLSEITLPSGGTVYLFGGGPASISFEQTSAFADMLVCGVTGGTIVKEKVYGQKGYGDLRSTIHPIMSGDLLFLRVGSPNTDYGAVILS